MKQTEQIIGRTGGVSTLSLAIAANTDMNGFILQNTSGTGVLFVKMGSDLASTADFDYILKPGTVDSDGNGGVLQMTADAIFMGGIYVASAGTTAYVAFSY